MESVKLPVGISLSTFMAAVQSVILSAAEAKVKLPSLKNIPNGANPKAVEKYWREFVEKYKERWKKYKNEPDRQWGCCVVIWTRYCLKRKIQPFDTNAGQVSQDAKNKTEDITKGARSSQLQAVNALMTMGTKKGLISKKLKEVFDGIEEKKPGEFTVTSHSILRLSKGVDFNDSAFRDLVVKKGYVRKNHGYEKTVKTNTTVRIAMDEDKNVVVYFKNKLTSAYTEMLLGINHTRGNREELKKALAKYWRALIREIKE